MQDNSQTSLAKTTGSLWNLDTLQSLIRAALKIGGGFLVAKGMADESALEVISAGLIALVGILWGIWHRAPAAPASPPPHQMPLLLLVGLLIAAGCASLDTKSFRAEQAAADTAYASLLTWKQFYRAALTNSGGPGVAQLQARNEQVYAASRLLSATLQSADTLREICLTNSATADDGALGEQHLRDFQDNEKTIPTILTTSQKLSTGVDARNIRNIVLLRPINSMIEFKQIIGRGTRLYDGKDYFTIYDFVKAHLHFSDPEWDGEPIEPEPKPPRSGPPPGPPESPRPEPAPRRQKVKVKLADGKARTIQHMMCTSFWHPDGTPMSAQQFLELLFGNLPEFFHNEAEFRALWSVPDTRKKLLEGLAEKGFGPDQLAEMQTIIAAEKSDLFDVLAYVAYALPPVTREVRATNAKVYLNTRFSAKQQAFLDFVLSHYVTVGVAELDQDKLTPLLRLKYHNAIADALADLGQPAQIRSLFVGFQQYLYQPVA